jgi:uncharacterized integral membrane protein
MALIRWTFGFIIALLTAAFAVLNLAPVPFSWSPFHPTIELPLYVIGLGLMGASFLLGAFTVWISTDPLHREQRRQRKTIKNLEKELETLHEGSGPDSKAAPATGFSALLSRPK